MELLLIILSLIEIDVDVRSAASVSKTWATHITESSARLDVTCKNGVQFRQRPAIDIQWSRFTIPTRLDLVRRTLELKRNTYRQLLLADIEDQVANNLDNILGTYATHVRELQLHFCAHLHHLDNPPRLYTFPQLCEQLIPVASFRNLVKLDVHNVFIKSQPRGFSFPKLEVLNLVNVASDQRYGYTFISELVESSPLLRKLFISTADNKVTIHSESLCMAFITRSGFSRPSGNEEVDICAPHLTQLTLGHVGLVFITDTLSLELLTEDEIHGPVGIVWINDTGLPPQNCKMRKVQSIHYKDHGWY